MHLSGLICVDIATLGRYNVVLGKLTLDPATCSLSQTKCTTLVLESHYIIDANPRRG